jgi:hypothetical protein
VTYKIKSEVDPILGYIRRLPTRYLKRAAVRMEIVIRDGWTRRHLEKALLNKVKTDTSPNSLMTYYLYK